MGKSNIVVLFKRKYPFEPYFRMLRMIFIPLDFVRKPAIFLDIRLGKIPILAMFQSKSVVPRISRMTKWYHFHRRGGLLNWTAYVIRILLRCDRVLSATMFPRRGAHKMSHVSHHVRSYTSWGKFLSNADSSDSVRVRRIVHVTARWPWKSRFVNQTRQAAFL